MYSTVDTFLEYESRNMDAWYNVLIFDTIEYIEEFTDEDWDNLLKELPKKSNRWKMRLAECIGYPENKNKNKVIEALLYMAQTDDNDLFFKVITSLLAYDINDIENINEIYEKVENHLKNEKDDLYIRNYQNFLKKNLKQDKYDNY